MSFQIFGGAVLTMLLSTIATSNADVVPPTLTEDQEVRWLHATGLVLPIRSVTLAAQNMGRITETFVGEGEQVKFNQRLVQLDDAVWQADLASAKASLLIAQAESKNKLKAVERLKLLRSKQTLSQDRLDEAEFAYAAAKGKVAQSKAQIARATAILKEAQLKAPFGGVVIEKQAELGMLTQPGVLLYRIEDQSQLKLRAQIKEQDIGAVSIGQSVSVTIPAISTEPVESKVLAIIPSGDAQSHSFTIDIALPTGDEAYLPGMFGKLKFRAQ